MAKGHTQEAGIDFHDTFAPVAKGVTVKTVVSLAASKWWSIFQLDINNAFLHEDLDEEVYMDLPLGYQVPATAIPLVCKLLKSIYGLLQTSRCWFRKLSAYGFTRSLADYSLFTYQQGSIFVCDVVYVDDILLTGTSLPFIQALKTALHDKFNIKDLGEAKYYLGL